MTKAVIKGKVTKAGTITIPKTLRKKYSIEEGDVVGYLDTGDGIKILPYKLVEIPPIFEQISARLQAQNVDVDKIVKAVRKVRPKVYGEEYGGD